MVYFRVLCFFLTICVRFCAGKMDLDGPEYAKMPPVYHLDPYEECFFDPGGVYCDINFALVSDEPSALLNMIQQYSSENVIHYNHSNLDYGICITKKYKNRTEPMIDRKMTLERWLNHTFWKNYKLKTRVKDPLYCGASADEIPIDGPDIFVAVMSSIIITLNLLGSLLDFFGANCKFAKGLVSCFSLRQNWNRLVATPDQTNLPTLKNLKPINGIKVICMVFVISIHSFLPVTNYMSNTQYFESFFNNYFYYIIFNGTIIMQTFFIISGCLFVIKYCLDVEEKTANIMTALKFIFFRWLRLTLPYAFLLGFTSTWMRHLGSGPLWQRFIGNEVKDCRRNWWMHLLYVNNYFTGSECMGQTWYLAADMQLYCVSICVFVFFKSVKSRKIILTSLFLIGCLFRMWNTYYHNLDPILTMTPEQSRYLFQRDKNFIHLYVPGHTNLPACVIGLTLGYIAYTYQNHDIEKFKKYRQALWLIPLVLVGIIYTGLIFIIFRDAVSMYYMKIFFSAASVTLFDTFVAILILGCIFKIEDIYTSFLEWNGWTISSKLTYSAYLVHIGLIRYVAGTKAALIHTSFIVMLMYVLGTVTLSFAGAFVFWLVVEAPLNQIFKALIHINRKARNKNEVV
ncbi:nose resistant to fluoxetine protein 6 isoform X2 [Bombyx mori]|uniref:nose resistant to fluoxetine protein 6 isoform X2 n=1 Tax=Bombyx mori TaxID=7091 RepID=UPI002ED4A5F6